MNFYSLMRDTEPEKVERMKSLQNNTAKVASTIVRKEFLIKCRKHNVFPDFITDNVGNHVNLFHEGTPYINKLESASFDNRRRLLNLLIKDTFYYLNGLFSQRNQVAMEIISMGDPEITGTFLSTQSKALETAIKNERKTCEEKFNAIYNESVNEMWKDEDGEEKNLYILTEKEIPKEVRKILSLGPKFALPLKNCEVPYMHIIAEVENLSKTFMNQQTQSQVRSKCVNLLTNFSHRHKNIKSNAEAVELNRLYDETKSFLKDCERKQEPLVVINADKGNRSVIMDQKLYLKTVEKILEDTATFKKLDGDPTEKIEDESNKLIDEMYNKKYIKTTAERFFLKTKNSVPPLMYSLPKIHKISNTRDIKSVQNELKGRPVISSIGSPTYKLSKYISKILAKSFASKFNVRNSSKVVEDIKNLKIPKDHVMISLDVKSLFPSVPVDLIVQSIKKRWEDIKKNTEIDKDLFIKIVRFLLRSSYFKVNDIFYKQISGAAIGDPFSPIAVDFAMEELTEECLRELGFDPTYCVKYVDDFFLIIPAEEVENTLTIFNNYNSKIQFTIEVEDKGTIPFLDIKIFRKIDGTLVTEWYSKPMSSNRMLNFKSSHKLSQKINVAYQTIKRICDLTTAYPPDNNYNLIKGMLRKNGYPVNLIKKLFEKYKKQAKRKDNEEEKPIRKFRALTNIDGLTQGIQSCINKFDKNIVICPKNVKTVGNLHTKVKDKLEMKKQSNLVYSIPCLDCDKSYIGLTQRQYLETRIGQHKDNVKGILNLSRKLGVTSNNIKGNLEEKLKVEEEKGNEMSTRTKNLRKLQKDCEKSGLVTHVAETGHNLDYKNTKIVDRSNHKNTLEILEILHIKINKNLNKKEDLKQLGGSYDGLLLNLKR